MSYIYDCRKQGVERSGRSNTKIYAAMLILLNATPLLAQELSNIETSGGCSPVVGEIQGDIIINCSNITPSVPSFKSDLVAHIYREENVEFMSFLKENEGDIIHLDLYIETDDQSNPGIISQFCSGNYHSADSTIKFQLPVKYFDDVIDVVYRNNLEPWRDDLHLKISNFSDIVLDRCGSAVSFPIGMYVSYNSDAGGVHGYAIRGQFSVSTSTSYREVEYMLNPV